MAQGADRRARPVEVMGATLVSAAASLVLLLHHIRPGVETMLTHGAIRGRPYMVVALELHNQLEDFYRRRVTTLAIEQVHASLGTGLPEAFALVNFTFLALSGVALFVLVRRLSPRIDVAWFALALFYTSFGTVFLFFVPVFGWDDPIQYASTFVALAAFVPAVRRGRAGDWAWYIVLFSVALVVRESGVFLLPGMLLLAWPRGAPLWPVPLGALRRAVLVGAPAVVYVGYRLLLAEWGPQSFEYKTADRFGHFVTNFLSSSSQLSVSVMSLVLVLLPPCHLLWTVRHRIPARVAQALWLTLALNTVVVSVITYAREARLYSLALLLVWPLLAVHALPELRRILAPATWQTAFRTPGIAALFAGGTAVNGWLSFVWFRPQGPDFQTYAFLALEVVVGLECLRRCVAPVAEPATRSLLT